jgi:hypothetical protein
MEGVSKLDKLGGPGMLAGHRPRQTLSIRHMCILDMQSIELHGTQCCKYWNPIKVGVHVQVKTKT